MIFEELGLYDITLIAFDTICGINDTAYLTVNHDQVKRPEASFFTDFVSCDADRKVNIINNSNGANSYRWDFGDGNSSDSPAPRHSYDLAGDYTIRLIAADSLCDEADTSYVTVSFTDSASWPEPSLTLAECNDGSVETSLSFSKPWHSYQWQFDNKTLTGVRPKIKFQEAGLKRVRLIISDSLCNREYIEDIELNIEKIGLETYAPNAFHPNDDGLNDYFEIFGAPCEGENSLRIFNRWGELVFETDQPYREFWDGRLANGVDAPAGVYTYVILTKNEKINGYLSLIR
jgi:gliding motility-associated-like protein